MAIKKYQLTQEQSSIPRYVMPAIAILLLTTGVLLFLLTQGLRVGEPQAVSIDFAEAATQGKDLVISLDNLTVIVPKEVTSMRGSVAIVLREPNLFAFAGGAEWRRPQIFNVEYRNGLGTPVPHVLFSKPILLCFKLSPEQWQDYSARPNDYQIEYYAEDQNIPRWLALPITSNAESSQLCAQTEHFSLFALAIKLKESIPITGPTTLPSPTARFAPTPHTRDNEDEPVVVPTQAPPEATSSPIPTEPPTEPPTQPPIGPPTEPPTQAPTDLPLPTLPIP